MIDVLDIELCHIFCSSGFKARQREGLFTKLVDNY
jgi:hypothetical protein